MEILASFDNFVYRWGDWIEEASTEFLEVACLQDVSNMDDVNIILWSEIPDLSLSVWPEASFSSSMT